MQSGLSLASEKTLGEEKVPGALLISWSTASQVKYPAKVVPIQGRVLAIKSMTERIAIVALAVGAILIVLGAVGILESGPEAVYRLPIGPSIPEPVLLGYRFDVSQLATGIAVSLAGTAAVSASLTYLLLNRKRKTVCASPGKRPLC